ncbi:MAG: methyltransferase, TrmH family [Frankiaceae bacterium]|nr:methyltransferase, TrmH family [Frankiaceae bacterium]
MFVTEAAVVRDADVLRTAAANDIPVVVVTDRVAATLSETVTPQGVFAVVRPAPLDADSVLAGARLVAVLDRVNDPGNAGTAIRTADAAGADAVILTQGSVDPHNGKCIRASAGSVFAVPILSGLAPAAALELAGGGGARTTIATTVDAEDDLDALVDAGALAGPTSWVFGSEAHGLDPAVAAAADRRVRIPMYGSAESLNLATSVAVCLYASARAHRR